MLRAIVRTGRVATLAVALLWFADAPASAQVDDKIQDQLEALARSIARQFPVGRYERTGYNIDAKGVIKGGPIAKGFACMDAPDNLALVIATPFFMNDAEEGMSTGAGASCKHTLKLDAKAINSEVVCNWVADAAAKAPSPGATRLFVGQTRMVRGSVVVDARKIHSLSRSFETTAKGTTLTEGVLVQLVALNTACKPDDLR